MSQSHPTLRYKDIYLYCFKLYRGAQQQEFKLNYSRLFKSIEFGNGSQIFDQKSVIFEFKYLQSKKW